MIGVRTDRDDYRIAVAELPLRARIADSGPGCIEVVGPHGPVSPDAAAVVLVAAARGEAACIEAAGDEVVGSVPVVVDRPLLRADVVADAGARPDATLFTVQAAAAPGDLAAVVRDGIGWLRALSGEELRLDTAAATDGALLALLRAGDRAATLLVTVLADDACAPRLRAMAIGVTRTEVAVGGGSAASVVRCSEEGSLRLPTRWESRQRLSLRRALDAIEGATCGDLDQWRHDEHLAATILTADKYE